MKNIIVLSVLLAGLSSLNMAIAQDDVYDAPVSRPAKVKSSQPVYSERSEQIVSPEKTQPYTEEGQTTSRLNGSNYSQNNDRYSNGDTYSDDWNYGYTDRIRRFHNPSIQFNYGWNNWYNNYYSPWNSYYGMNNWDYYSFTPSWMYSYNNFYNPFCGSSVVFYQPGFSSWYNTGFCSPFSSWNYYNSWYGFSPYCANTIYNYGYSNYGGYYDSNKKNVIYAPRTGGYNNSGYSSKSNYNNYPSSTNTNNTGGFNNTNNTPTQQQAAPTKKWENRNSNNNYSNPNPDNVYRYNNPQPSYNNNNNNGWNNSSRPEPSINSNPGNSGVKIGTRPK